MSTSRRTSLRFIRVIRKVADCPCPKHQRAFLAALGAVDELVCKVATTSLEIDAGPHTARNGHDVAVATVVAHDRVFILAFPTPLAARRHDPDATYVALARDVVFRMALDAPELSGVLVTAARDDDAWAAATTANISTMLAASA